MSSTTRQATRARGVCLRADEVRTLKETGAVVVRRRATVPGCDVPGAYFDAYNGGPVWCWRTSDGRQCNGHGMLRCPLGAPGDALWGREAWAPRCDVDPAKEPGKALRYVLYRAGGSDLEDMHWHSYPACWRSAATMPRWASRFPRLRVASVAVERATGGGDGWEWVVRIERREPEEGGQ